jgi:serine/threonine protein phosphatase 1
MPGRTLVIGDIHGCYDEFRALLDKAGPTADDRVIAIGDLINRGPKSAEVLRFFREQTHPGISSIMGNMEHKFLRAHRGETRPSVSLMLTRWQIGPELDASVAYMEAMPPYLDLPEATLVHGYWEPGLPLEKQREEVLTGVAGDFFLDDSDQPWWALYDGPKPLIAGHRDWSGVMKPFVYQDRVWGIDTRCVYGGTLTGLWLPDFTLVSVPARRDHWLKFRKRYLFDAD